MTACRPVQGFGTGFRPGLPRTGAYRRTGFRACSGAGRERLQSVYLIGFMGSGKTTLGKRLAPALGLPFKDLDEEILRDSPLSISEIFQVHGEAYFRELEWRTLKTLPGPAVFALGGGAFMTAAIRNHIRETGVSLYLELPFSVLLKRIGGDLQRPLAQDPEILKALYDRRLETYRRADVIWRSPIRFQKSVGRVLREVLVLLAGHGIVPVVTDDPPGP